MENEPVLMGYISDERDRFSMHICVCMHANRLADMCVDTK